MTLKDIYMDSPPYEDSPVYDRNPSPPAELLEHSELLRSENIGDTVFSQHWLFTTLMKLIEEVDKENEDTESELVVDVDEELQNELCKLWDMSMNSEVAKFLNEFKAVEILTGIISKTKAPRVTEICVGILGNMACETNVCKNMAENHKFIDLMLVLLESRDVPTLVESMRLMYTSISNTGTQGPWIKAIQRSEEFLEHVTFIFSSSTNCDLLKNTAGMVDTLLDLENDLCVSWATDNFIGSLIEATGQIGINQSAALEVYLNIFQSFSTTEPGVEALVSHSDSLGKTVLKYLNIICEYEIVGLGGKEGPLASALSVLNILMNMQPRDFIFTLCRDEQLIRILLKILEPLYPIINQKKSVELKRKLESVDNETIAKDTEVDKDLDTDKKPNEEVEKKLDSESNIPNEKGDEIQQQSVGCSGDVNDNAKGEKEEGKDLVEKVNRLDNLEEEEIQTLAVLHDILSQFLREYCKIVFEEPQNDSIPNGDSGEMSAEEKENECDALPESDQETTCNKGDNSPNKLCLSILTYLDDACSRSRINYLGLTLKETQIGCDLFEKLRDLGEHNEKERLVRILKDVDNFRIVGRAESCTVTDKKE